MDILTRHWLLLIGFTAMTVALAMVDSRLAVVGLLALAWAKMRTILGGFLHLGAASGWLRAVMVPLGLWLALIGALYALSTSTGSTLP